MTEPQHLWEEPLPGGAHASFILKRGQLLRITDPQGDANVSLLLFNAHEKSERLNLPDTLKCQHTARLTQGHCLYSDMGRILAVISADTCGWHDSLGGVANAAEVLEKYGEGRYQERRNGFFRNGTQNLLVELGKWNLGLEDLLMVLNLFSRVDADAEGMLHFHPGNSQPGNYVELFAPMDTLVVLTALQHPMDPNPVYAPKGVELRVSQLSNTQITPLCQSPRAENQRGFHNTARLFA